MKPSFTNHLKSLVIGGAMAASVIPQIQAATSLPDQTSIADRVNKVREAVGNSQASVLPAGANASDADIMWWRNAWGNGGWHNWHNGWRNGGGWGNWHNF
jgi:hypothetical protein